MSRYLACTLMPLLGLALAAQATTSECPHCRFAQPRLPEAGGMLRGYLIPLSTIADEILAVFGACSAFGEAVPAIHVRRSGAIEGEVLIGGCEDCCSGLASRLAVQAVLDSIGAEVPLIRPEHAPPSVREVRVKVIGPRILDARTDLTHRHESSTRAGMDSNSDSWSINSHFTIQGQSTIIATDFWGSFDAVVQASRESGQVETPSVVLDLFQGDADFSRIVEEAIGLVTPHCLCVASDSGMDLEQTVLDALNLPPSFRFQDVISISIPGTTIIQNAFHAEDPDNDPLHIVLPDIGIPPDYATYSVASSTGTLSIIVDELPPDEMKNLLRVRTVGKLVHIFDLKECVTVAPGELPAEDEYYHGAYTGILITYVPVDQESPQ